MNSIRVRMGDYLVSNGQKVLVTTVGSCVAVGLSNGNDIGGLAHIMLPEVDGKTDLIGKYADTAIPAMIEEISGYIDINELEAKIAGGAQMFSFPSSSMSIGKRNVQKVEEVLKEMGIKIKGEDVGKNHGRTVEFHTAEGKMLIKQSNTVVLEL
ncbi:MAG: chemotaxis protein CheD [Archaeoglobaceae archaeon]